MSCGDPNDPDCAQVLERVYEYLDGELDLSDIERIRVHLEECGPCLRQYDLDVALKALIRRSCACEQAPAELRERIMLRITQVRLELS
jgi:mycothiol system anti-sigma-R factor